MKGIFLLGLLFVNLSLQAKELTLPEKATLYESYAFEARLKYEEAAKKIGNLYETHKDNYFLNMRLGNLYSLAKKASQSVGYFQRAATISPGSLEPWLALAQLHVNTGDYKKAEAVCWELLKRDRENYHGLMHMAMSMIALKKYSDALSKVEDAMKLYPLDPTFLEQKGYLLVKENKMDAARETLGLLLLISPQNAYAKSFFKK